MIPLRGMSRGSAGAIIAFIMATWPDVSWTVVEYGGVAVMIATRD